MPRLPRSGPAAARALAVRWVAAHSSSTYSAANWRIAKALTVNLDLNLRSASGGNRTNSSSNGLNDLQHAAVNQVQEWFCRPSLMEARRHSDTHKAHDTAVLLVSRSLAAWLDNDVFLARLLAATGLSHHRHANTAPLSLSLLAAAVDQVPLYDLRRNTFAASEGLSILRTHRSRLLPTSTGPSGPASPPTSPSLRFVLPTAGSNTLLHPTIDLPLANTVFVTGRPHAVSASRWDVGDSGLPVLREKTAQVPRQTLYLSAVEDNHIHDSPGGSRRSNNSSSTLAVPLIALTPPRKIHQSLGNILSQVWARGARGPTPASEELERAIPRLLDLRAKSAKAKTGLPPPAGPVDVWALTIPPRQSGRDGEPVDELPALNLEEYRLEKEGEMARVTEGKMADLLARGCRLHRVLSGGGGWGLKRGLLSLDPETELPGDEAAEDTGHDSLSSFLASLKGQTGEDCNRSGDSSNGNGNGIASPGMYVQFLVEPALFHDNLSSSLSSPSVSPGSAVPRDEVLAVLGTTTRSFDDDSVGRGGGEGGVRTEGSATGALPDSGNSDGIYSQPNVFGAVSAAGMYLSGRSTDAAGNGRETDERVVATKLDVPGSWVVASLPGERGES